MEAGNYCQSCGMPLTKEEEMGTNQDGSKNQTYCLYCYKDGQFTFDCTMNEMIELNLKYSREHGILEQFNKTEEELRAQMQSFFPDMQRWHCTCTDACASGYNPDCTCTSSECHCTEKQ